MHRGPLGARGSGEGPRPPNSLAVKAWVGGQVHGSQPVQKGCRPCGRSCSMAGRRPRQLRVAFQRAFDSRTEERAFAADSMRRTGKRRSSAEAVPRCGAPSFLVVLCGRGTLEATPNRVARVRPPPSPSAARSEGPAATGRLGRSSVQRHEQTGLAVPGAFPAPLWMLRCPLLRGALPRLAGEGVGRFESNRCAVGNIPESAERTGAPRRWGLPAGPRRQRSDPCSETGLI